MGVIQTLKVELDKQAVAAILKEVAGIGAAVAEGITGKLAQLKGNEAGAKAAREVVAGLRRGFEADLDALRLQFERGIVKPEAFERKAVQAAQAYNNALKAEVAKVAADPSFTENPFKGVSLKETEDDGKLVGESFKEGAKTGAKGAGEALSEAILDRLSVSEASAREVGGRAIGAFVDALGKSKLGPEGGKAAGDFVAGMRQEFDRNLGAIRQQVVDGTLPAAEFGAKAEALAADFATRFEAATAQLKTGDVDFSKIPAAATEAGRQAGDELAKGFEETDAPKAAGDAGMEAARKFVEAIKAESKRSHDEVRLAQAEGFMSPVEAEKKGVEISSRVNRSLLDGVKQFRQRSDFSPQMLGIFSDAFERIGEQVPPKNFFERVKRRIGTQLVTVGASIVGFFAARRLFAFGGESVREFLAEDKALQGLKNQIDATGASYARFGPTIDAITARLVTLGAASQGQTAAGISALIALSHDADKSIRNIGIAADFAAKHNISFEQAVELVGRAMIGQTRGLNLYGIVVKKGDDAVLAMAKDSAGFAERQAPQLQRAVARLSFEWANLKSSIGEALVDAGGGVSTIDLLTVAIRDGVTWIKAHREEIARWGAALVNLGVFFVKSVVVPIVRGTTIIVESFEDVGLTLQGLWQRFKFIGGGFALIAADIRDAWAGVLDMLGFQNADKVADETNRNLRAWGEKVQAEAVKQKAEIDRKLGVLRTPPSERTPRSTVQTRAGGPSRFATATPAPGGAIHGAGFDPNANPDDKLGARIALLTKAAEIENLRASALLGLGKIETDIAKILARTNLPLERRIALEEHLNTVQRALGTLPLAKLTTSEQLGVLEQTVKVESLRAESLANLARLEEKLAVQMNDGTKSLEFRAQAEADLRRVQDLRGTRPFESLDLDKRIALLTQATEIESMREAALADLRLAEEELRKKIAEGNHTREERIALDQQLVEIEKTLGTRQTADLGLQEQITLFQSGLDNVATFAESLRGLQAAEARLAKEVAESIPGTQRRFELEMQLYQLRQTLGRTSLDDQIALLDKAVQSEETRAQALRELIRLEKELIELQKKTGTTPEAREEVGARQSRVAAALARAPQGEVRSAREAPETRGNEAQGGAGADVEVPIVPRQDTKTAVQEFRDQLAQIGAELPPVQIPFKDDLVRTFFDNLDEFAHNAADGIGEIFESTFKNVLGIMDAATKQQVEDLERRRAQVVESMNRKDITSEGREKLQGELDDIDNKLKMLHGDALNVGQALANLGKGMAKSILKEIAAMAKGKALENVAVAIEETAKGFAALASLNPAAASLHFKAAGTAALAAVKWGLVAGGAGALAGSSSSGGGGGNAGSNRDTEKSDPGTHRQSVTFYIKGGLLNTDDHRQMDELAKGIRAVTDRDVVIRRG